MGVWGSYPQKGSKGQSPLVGVRGKPPEASAFSKWDSLEFVQQVDDSKYNYKSVN